MRGRKLLASIHNGHEPSTHLSKHACDAGGNFYRPDLGFCFGKQGSIIHSDSYRAVKPRVFQLSALQEASEKVERALSSSPIGWCSRDY